jgi:hypothetical protein
MHDSLDLSVSSPDVSEMVARLGEEVIKLEVPMKVDVRYGRTWGDAKHTWAELHVPETSTYVEPAVELPGDQERTQCESPKFSNDFDKASHLTGREIPDASDDLPWEGDDPPWEDDIAITTLNEMTETPIVAPALASDDGFSGFTADVQGYDRGKINCPFHEDRTPSCQLYNDGHYHCFGCGAHGQIAEDLDISADALASAASTEDDTKTLERGLELWGEGKPIAGTLAARYLTDTRKLNLAALPIDINAVLRFHPHCPFGTNGARHPCLLALFRDVETDTPAGIHRIGLTPNANKIKRLTLGRWPSPRAIKLWPATHKLTIGEGIETVLGAIRCNAITPPVWAMGPKADIANFPVLPGIKAITVLVDRGDPAALDGAEACAARYVAAGIPARWLRTVRVKDFNDLVLP